METDGPVIERDGKRYRWLTNVPADWRNHPCVYNLNGRFEEGDVFVPEVSEYHAATIKANGYIGLYRLEEERDGDC